MKFKNHKMLSKVLCPILACVLIMSMLAGCGSTQKAPTKDDVVKEVGEAFMTQAKMAEKFGPFSLKYTYKNETDKEAVANLIVDKDWVLVSLENYPIYVYDGKDWYVQAQEQNTYSKIVEFDTTATKEYFEQFLYMGTYNFEEDENVEIKATNDGYIWTVSAEYDKDSTEKYYTSIKETVTLNKDFSIKEEVAEMVLKDGSKATLTTTINYGEKDLKDITSLRKILDDAGDKTRKMTYHIVKNGNIIKTYETEVPYGCYCNPTFSSQVVDSEDKNLYVDKNCKTPVDSDTSNLTKDAVAYIKGK